MSVPPGLRALGTGVLLAPIAGGLIGSLLVFAPLLFARRLGRTAVLVGFALALPNINLALKHTNGKLFPFGLFKILYHQRLIRNLRVIALGVVEEYRASGLAAAFYATLIRNSRRLGYRDCEMSWILEDNVLMNRAMEMMGGKVYKRYRIYEKPL